MNHSWGKSFIENGFVTQICNTCGCKRNKIQNEQLYSRSGIVFGLESPDCIDEEFEKTKTID